MRELALAKVRAPLPKKAAKTSPAPKKLATPAKPMTAAKRKRVAKTSPAQKPSTGPADVKRRHALQQAKIAAQLKEAATGKGPGAVAARLDPGSQNASVVVPPRTSPQQEQGDEEEAESRKSKRLKRRYRRMARRHAGQLIEK